MLRGPHALVGMEEIVFIPLIPMRLHYFRLFANQIRRNLKGWGTGIVGKSRTGERLWSENEILELDFHEGNSQGQGKSEKPA